MSGPGIGVRHGRLAVRDRLGQRHENHAGAVMPDIGRGSRDRPQRERVAGIDPQSSPLAEG